MRRKPAYVNISGKIFSLFHVLYVFRLFRRPFLNKAPIFLCFQFKQNIPVPERIHSKTGYTIHITNGSELIYSLTMSDIYYLDFLEKNQFKMSTISSDSKARPYRDIWVTVDTIEAISLLKQCVCGIGEINPLGKTFIWGSFTLNCEIHTYSLNQNTEGIPHQKLGLKV